MIKNSTLYSIGHGLKEFEALYEELRAFGIQFLIDVRSSPYSKWATQFNREIIEDRLRMTEITYVYMGDAIGGRPLNDECYDEEGYFDYKKMAQTTEFQRGLKRLLIANEKGLKVAIMCSEVDPSECHRSKLIGRELYFEHGIEMMHIINAQTIVGQVEIMEKLDSKKGRWKGNSEPSLFAEDDLPVVPAPYFKSVKAYRNKVNSDFESMNPYDN